MERKVSNITADLLTQQAESPLKITTAVEGILELTARSGKKYSALEYVDENGELKRVTIWDKKLLEGLEKGTPIELLLEKNTKGFWNLAGMSRLEAVGEKPETFTKEPPITPVGAVDAPKSVDMLHDLLPSIPPEKAMMGAVSLVTTFKDVLKPQNQGEIMDQVTTFYTALLHINERKT